MKTLLLSLALVSFCTISFAEQAVNLPSAQTEGFNQQIQDAQARLMSNPETMQALMQLAQDPAIAPLLSDPQLVAAVTAKDANAIANNPKAQQLMNDPRMQKLIQQLQAQSGTSK